MSEVDDQASAVGSAKPKKWQSRLLACLLIIAGGLHGFKPQWLTLDWPTIVLVFAGVFLFFVPLDDLGEIFESLEFGKTKILFRKVKKLDQSVDQAQLESINQGKADVTLPRLSINASAETLQTRETSLRSSKHRIELLLSADKEMALIRVGVEIEGVLAEIESGLAGGTASRGIVWSRTMRSLVEAGKIPPQVSKALTEFRNVRNQLIHPSRGRIPEAAVASAVDSGLKLLSLLENIRDA